MQSLLPRMLDPDDAEAVRVDGRTLSYRALAERVAIHLARLDALGVGAGERVGVFTHASLDVVAALVAQVTHGVVTVPLNPALGARELEHMLSDAAPVAVFVDGARRAELPVSPALAGRLHDMADSDVGSPSRAWAPRAVSNDVALILYTSGTTGAPKGAQLSSANLAANLDALALTWGWTASDTVVHGLPLFHVHGLVLGLLGALRVGGALHHVSRFTPHALAAALAAVTPGRALLFAVPTMYHRLIEAAEAESQGSTGTPIANALRSARLLISGSAGLPTREHQRLTALTGRGIHERYGLTETLINCGVPAAEAPRPGYVGPALPGVELRRVDEARQPLPPEADDDATLGEVAVRGPSVFLGYLNREDATREVLDADGWFYTGDLATAARDGALRIVGRRSTDLIKTGGYKVGAGEIEAALLEHPDVAEAAVLGVPDADLGERIVAFVVPRAGTTLSADALRAHGEQTLTRHKQPREYRVVDALPRNAMGKVQKKRLLEPTPAAAPLPPEVRVDPFTGFPVIVSSARAQIRHGVDPGAGLPQPSGPCPFCPGYEGRTEPAVLRVPADEALPWLVRFVPNRYPWVVEGPLSVPFQHAPGGESHPALGVHDVVVEHPAHDLDLVDYDDAHVLLLLTALRDRVRTVEAVPGVLGVSLFRNRGRRAGSSQPHPHAQIVGASVLGPTQLARRSRAREHFMQHGTNLLASQVAVERAARERVLLDDGVWFAGCPFTPRHPYEVWLAPQVPKGQPAATPFSALTDQALGQLGGHLQRLVRATLAAAGKRDYNVVLHQLPVAEREAPHAYWCLEIAPRGGGGAGFELSTGLAMTSTRPEANAARIRAELAALAPRAAEESQ
ncbi:MAG: AMP-binding protein [Sandaracinaceae bacterium]|nr:AMP-binding protein [Sandaracinaceae bacterium]